MPSESHSPLSGREEGSRALALVDVSREGQQRRPYLLGMEQSRALVLSVSWVAQAPAGWGPAPHLLAGGFTEGNESCVLVVAGGHSAGVSRSSVLTLVF